MLISYLKINFKTCFWFFFGGGSDLSCISSGLISSLSLVFRWCVLDWVFSTLAIENRNSSEHKENQALFGYFLALVKPTYSLTDLHDNDSSVWRLSLLSTLLTAPHNQLGIRWKETCAFSSVQGSLETYYEDWTGADVGFVIQELPLFITYREPTS